MPNHTETFKKLHKTIKGQRPGRLSDGVILLHDNTTPHSAGVIRELLRKFKWEVWSHLPYSPDLAPVSYTHLDVYKRQALDRTVSLTLVCE